MGAYAAEGCFRCCAGFGGRFRLAFCAWEVLAGDFVGEGSGNGAAVNGLIRFLPFIPLLDFDASFGAIAAVLMACLEVECRRSKSCKSPSPSVRFRQDFVYATFDCSDRIDVHGCHSWRWQPLVYISLVFQELPRRHREQQAWLWRHVHPGWRNVTITEPLDGYPCTPICSERTS